MKRQIVKRCEQEVGSSLFDRNIEENVDERIIMSCTFAEGGVERVALGIGWRQKVGIEPTDPVSLLAHRHRFAGRNGVKATKKAMSATVEMGMPTIKAIQPR